MEFENTVDRGSAVNFGADSADCACLDVRILGPKREIWIIDLSTAMVGMLMSSSKIFLFGEAHLNSGPVHPYPNIFKNQEPITLQKRRFFSIFEKNPRPQEYDRYLVWRAFSKTSIFVVENAVYVWTGGANREKKSPFSKISGYVCTGPRV